ncbi:MAG: DNA/RNA non-specific endonuclease [Phycisphaerales bacterium JB038]
MKRDPGLELERLRDFLDDALPEGGVQRLADDPDVLEKIAPHIERRARSKKEAAAARSAMQSLARNEEVAPASVLTVEAIILPDIRPVVDIVNDSFDAPEGLWAHLGEGDVRQNLLAAIPSVGRVELRDYPGVPYVGSGFVVGADLIMTNRHVAEAFTSGLGRRGLYFRPGIHANVDFREEVVDSPNIELDVVEPVMVHPHWDMAILRVASLSTEQAPLKLSVANPEDLNQREIGVIGFPAFDSRNDADVQNQIFRGIYNVKRLQPGTLTGRQTIRSFDNFVEALKHNASTLGGNSGSAVIELGSGQVVGLHFAGIYKKSNYAVPTFELARDPYIQELGLSFAGSPPTGNVSWLAAWRSVDRETGDALVKPDAVRRTPAAADPVTLPTVSHPAAAGRPTATWTIPLQVSVGLGPEMHLRVDPPTTSAPSATATGSPAGPHAAATGAVLEAPPTLPDPHYGNRAGFDPDFLGEHAVLLPWLTNEQYYQTARNMQAARQRHVLPYHHFSVVMNRHRRIAFFTAVNVDGESLVEVDRDEFRDTWVLDPRIDASAQLDNEFYRDASGEENPLDRGHLVRRLDPCWGASRSEVIAAHHDTFHYTNCSPQHKNFNRSTYVWLGIESHILKNAIARDLRVSVLSGPVLRDDDPIYITPTGRQLQVPLAYWKVVAMVRGDGTLSATGYLLSQEQRISPLVEFAFGAYRSYQRRITAIEELTQLSFRGLHEFDPLESAEAAEAAREIGTFSDVRL